MFPANDIPTRYIALKALLSPHQEVRKEVALLESGKTPRCYNMDMSLSKLPGFVDFMLHDTEFLSRFVVTNDREMNFLTTFIPLARKSLLHDHSNWERSVIKRHGLTDARSHIFVRCVAYMHTPRDSPYKQALMLYFRLICKCIFTSQKPLQEMALRENIDMYFYEIVNGAPELCLQAFGKKELKEKLNRCLLMKESAECNILALSRAYAILCVFSDPLDVQVRHAQELVSRLNNIKDSVPFLSMGDARNLCANMCSAANLLDLSREYIQWRMDFKSATVSVIPPPTKMSGPPGPHGRGAVLPEDHNRGFQRFFYQANQLPMAATKSVDKVPPSMEHTINELLGRLERALPSPDTLSQCIHCGNKVSSTGNQILPTNWYVYECAMSSLLALSSHGALMHLPIRPASAANNASVITTPTTTTNAATATTTTTSSSTASPSSPQIDILGQDWITKRPLRSQVTMLHHCWSLVLIHNLPANASSVKAAAPEFPATLPLPRSANSPTLAAGPLNLTGAEDNDKPLSSSIFQIRRISLDIIANIFCWCPQLIDVKFLNSMKLAYSAAEEPILRGICRVLVSAVRPGIVHQPLSYPWMSVEHVVDIPSESQKSKSLLVNLMTDVGREFCKQILATVLPNKSPSNLLQQLEDVLIENEDSFEAYIKTMREKRLVLSALTVPTESPAESLSLPSSTLSDEQIASDNAKKAQEYATVSYYITTMHQWLYRFYADKPAIPVLAPLPTQVHLLYSARHAYTAPMITCKMADTLCLSTLKTSIFLYFRSSPADRKLLAHLTTSSVAYINDEAMPEWFNGKRFDTRDRYSAVRILSAFSEHLHCVDIAYVLFSLYFLSAEEVKCYEDNFLYYVTDCLVQELKSYSMPLLGKSGVSGLKEIAPGQEWRQPSDSTDEEVDSIFSGDSDDLGEPKRINALLAVHINLLLFCNHPEVIIRDVMKCSLLSLNTLLGFKDLPPVGLGLLLHNILHYMRQRHSIPLVHMALHSLKYILVLKQNRFTTSQWRKHSHILLQFLSQLKQFAEYYGDKPDSSSTSSASSSSLYSSPHNSSRLMSLIEEISRALHLSFLNAPTNEIKVQYLLSLCEWLQSRLSLLLRLATRQVRAMLDTCKPQLAAFPLHQLVEGLCRAVAFAEMEAIANKSQNVAVVPEGDSQTSQPPQQQQFTDTPPATMEGDIVDLKETELPHGSDLYAGKSDSLITDIAVFGKDALLTCLKCMNSESGASMNDLIVPLVDYIRTPENKYYRYLATEFITRACNCLAPGLAGSTGKLLAALLHAVLSDNDNESRVIARAIALLMPHAKDMTVNRIFQRVRHWYIESDPSVLRYERAATYLILSACRNCPQALRSNFKALVPLVFVAMSKPVAIRERPLPPSLHIGTDAAIRCRWESTWREMVNDPISCVMMHFNEILAFIAECITTAKYAIRRDQAGFALAHLAHEEYFTTVQQAKSLYQVIIPMCDAQTVYWERKFLLFRAIYSVICTRVLKKIDGSSLEAQEKQCVDILKREASAQSDNPLCIYENIEALFMLSFVVDFLQIDVLAEVFHLFQTFFAKLLVTEQLDDESMINLENLLTALPMFWSGEATEAQKSFFPQFLNLLDPMLHHSDTMIRFHALNALTELYKRVDISLYIADPQIESVIRGFFPALKHLVTEGTFPVIRMQMLKRVVLILSMLRGHFKEETEEILKLFGKETAETSLWYNDVVTY